MSGKMLPKMKHSKRHAEKLAKKIAENKLLRKNSEEQELRVAKLRYKKVMLSNYGLLPVLFAIVGIVCWTTNSFWIFLASACCYYVLIQLHHEQRIRKDEDPRFLTINDYELTTMAMNFCTMAGIIVAGIFSVGALIL